MTAPEMRDFDGFPMAVGEVYGLRVWRVDEYGRLRARHVAAPPWRPGENTATCEASVAMGGFVTASFGGPSGPGFTVQMEPAPERPSHATAPDEHCKCGFYAYTQPLAALADSGAVVIGVIRGTGRTLIGTKGFRCEKAEIVALLDPRAEDDFLPDGEVRPVGGPCQCPFCRVPDAPRGWDAWAADRFSTVYPGVPLLRSRTELTQFAPIQSTVPDPSTDEFWDLP
jgi:hypothetical protein